MNRTILFLSLLAISVINMMAEDIIALRSGDIIKAIVIEVGQNEIKYKKASNKKGPTYILSTNDILSITYENGDCDKFSSDNGKSNQKPAASGPQFIEPVADIHNKNIIGLTNIEFQQGLWPKKGKRSKSATPIMWYDENSILSTKDASMRIVGTICKSKYGNYVMRYYIEVSNKSGNNLYVDKASSFRISKDGLATSLFSNKTINITHGSGSNVNFGLGGIANALGVGGLIGNLANSVSLGSGSMHSSSTSYNDSQIIMIPPGGKHVLSQHVYEQVNGNNWQQISEAETFLFDKIDLEIKDGELLEFTPGNSPYKQQYVITFSTSPSFDQYSMLSANLYAKYVIGKELAPSFLKSIPSYPESTQSEADLIKIYSNAIPNFEDIFGRIILGREQKPDSKKSSIFGVKTK